MLPVATFPTAAFVVAAAGLVVVVADPDDDLDALAAVVVEVTVGETYVRVELAAAVTETVANVLALEVVLMAVEVLADAADTVETRLDEGVYAVPVERVIVLVEYALPVAELLAELLDVVVMWNGKEYWKIEELEVRVSWNP